MSRRRCSSAAVAEPPAQGYALRPERPRVHRRASAEALYAPEAWSAPPLHDGRTGTRFIHRGARRREGRTGETGEGAFHNLSGADFPQIPAEEVVPPTAALFVGERQAVRRVPNQVGAARIPMRPDHDRPHVGEGQWAAMGLT